MDISSVTLGTYLAGLLFNLQAAVDVQSCEIYAVVP